MLFDVYYIEYMETPSIQHRVKTEDIDQIIDWVKKTYTAYSFENTEEGDPDYSLYLPIDVCQNCNKKELMEEYDLNTEEDLEDEICSFCENSAYFELRRLEDTEEESLKLIVDNFGNLRLFPPYYESFIDLTKTEEVN